MAKIININTKIPESRELHIVLPADVPVGPTEIVITVSTPANGTTLGELLNSEFYGMWRDRSDITDSA